MGKLKLKLGDGYSIVATENPDKPYQEIFIDLEDPDGNFVQGLAVIGEEYTYQDINVLPLHGTYTVKVYVNPEYDDFTEEHIITRRKEEE